MKFVIQRVKQASVSVEDRCVGSIKEGYLILIGISNEDTEETADKMLKKTLNLRIFADEAGKTNRSLSDVGGELLLISQFTLYANCRKGNRPSFTEAGKPDHASALYDYLIAQARLSVATVAQGIFGADMQVSLLNDGPFTIVLDSKDLA